MTKNIRVDEDVHQQVMRIAKSNFRGMGDQVAYWAAMDCPHPLGMREEKRAHVVGSDDELRFFFCNKCKRHIVENDPSTMVKDQSSSSEKKRTAHSVQQIVLTA